MWKSQLPTSYELGHFCVHSSLLNIYRPQRSWAKVIFSQASVCPGGGVSASMHAGIYPHPRDHIPLGPQPPRDHTSPPAQTPLGPTPRDHTPPDQTHHSRKQTPAYGQRAAGTHPTGMHSCWYYISISAKWTNCQFFFIWDWRVCNYC